MSYRILHLFPNLMNLYGDYANMSLLTHYLREEEFDYEFVSSDTETDFSSFDMIYIGSGTEKSSLRALEILTPMKDELKNFVSNGGLLLLTGTSYEIFCEHITDERDGNFEGLGLIPATVERTHKKRYLGDVIYTFGKEHENIMGFINKCSQIKLQGEVLFETGNEQGNVKTGSGEGYLGQGIIATSLVGPVLVKNPSLCRWLMDKIYEKSGYQPRINADMSVQKAAFDSAYKELIILKQKM